MARFDVVTFDCYGTLIDWETGIREAFRRRATDDGVRVSPVDLLRAYGEVEREVEAEGYRSYRAVLRLTARRVAARFDWRLDEEHADLLSESLPTWRPFPDTNAALKKLAAAGCRVGILSNVDDDLLGETRRYFDVPFDLLVTAQQVRSYKPAEGHFEAARRKIGSDLRWVHAAQSYFHDVVPCKRLGIPVAWINRKGEKAGDAGPPDREFPDLARFAAWATSAPG